MYDRGVVCFNCTLRIVEQIDGPMKYVANIKRCEMDLTKCEFFNEIEADDLCGYFSKVEFQQGFLNNISSTLSCPVQPAEYRFTNNKWDMTSIVNLPGSAYRWNITATVTQLTTGRVVYCTVMMARIVVIRKKGNRNKQRKN
uniref:MD-2-related lipid-recognition domain-containing protein n=1 Tax=Anopheles atroparvus TaxID=41427 RepID=A0A182JJV5_ANOAO